MQTNVSNISRQSVAQAVALARQKVADSTRWLNAVNKAYQELELNQWIFDGATLRIASRTQRVTYHVTEHTCGCTSHAHGKPCWHRASFKLLTNAAQLAA